MASDNDDTRHWKNHSDTYLAVQRLHGQLSFALQNDKNKDIPFETKTSARSLIYELKEAMSTWEKNIASHIEIKPSPYTVRTQSIRSVPENKIKAVDEALFKTCQSSIHTYADQLMHEPDFWSKIGKAINEFTTSCGFGPLFTINDKSHLISDEDAIEESIKPFRLR